MKKIERKGFTLIELLAVIVILGVLLAIAIPSVSKYISTSRKSTYVSNTQSYVDAVKGETYIGGEISFPVGNKEATVVTFEKLREFLEKGGKQSPYGGDFDLEKSFVMIVNIGTPESPRYKYYIAAIDKKGYGIGVGTNPKVIEYDSLRDENIVQLGVGGGVSMPTVGGDPVPVTGDEAEVRLNATVTHVYDKTTPTSNPEE